MKPSPVVRRRFIIAVVLLVLFMVTGFFILPPIVKSQLEKRLTETLGRTVTVAKVRVNPYTLAVTLEEFDVQLKEGNGSFMGWRRLYVNFDPLSSLTSAWTLGDVELDGLHVAVGIEHDGALSFADILARVIPPNAVPVAASSAPARPIRISSLKVTDARVGFSDLSLPEPFVTAVESLSFSVTEFITSGERGAPYHFEASTEAGARIRWTGTLHAAPLRSAGELSLEQFRIAKYAPYFADRMQADVTEGRLSVSGHYELSLEEKNQVMKLREGALHLRGFKLLERSTQEPVLELPVLDVTGVAADVMTQKAAIGAVSLAGGRLRVRREIDGAINLLAMLTAPAATAAKAPAEPAVPTPDVSIGAVNVQDFQVDVTDLAAPRPAQLGLSGIRVSLKNVSLAENAPMPLQFAMNWAPHGTVQVEGVVQARPVKADLKVDVNAFEILALSPYLEQFINARITQGSVSSTLKVLAAVADDKSQTATISGDLTVVNFGLVDGVHNEELAGFGALSLSGLRVGKAADLTVAIDEVNVAAPYARVIMNSDQTLNLANLVRASEPSAPPAAPSPAPKVTIGKVVISDGEYRFNDHAIEPTVQMAINHFGGTIAGLSSENMAKATVDLKATVDGAGPIAISGTLDPLGAVKSADLKVDFKNVDLLPLSPYSGKFAGFELARGKFGLDVTMRLDGEKIDSANVITLSQFTFGASTDSPDATKLPVRLGVALLKDNNGQIVIDVPVEGSTDDPSFRIGRVVWRVIGNLLTKAAVSPFALLGSMFGGGGDELGFQEFAPGFAVLQSTEITKLATMVKALNNRPGLNVDLEGSYDRAADSFALKGIKFADIVRRAIWEAKHNADPNIAPPEKLEITPEENLAMVRKLFDEQFPPGTEFGTPLPAPPVVATPPPPPPAGFIKSVVNAFTFKKQSEERAVEEENARLAAEREQTVATDLATGLPLGEMVGRLAETVEIDDQDLSVLAQARAEAVRDYFTSTGKIAPDRLFLAKTKAGALKEGRGPRVFLNLQ